MTDIHIERYTGAAIEPLIPALAELRTLVFREYPYLYDGGVEYEAEYLSTYVDTTESLCVVVRDGPAIVGASTALPLADADPAFRRPFPAVGIDPSEVFYFGESVLQKDYRGRGIGHRFFEEREDHARELGRFSLTAFCAVQRPGDHPLRPAGYRPLDKFWERQGYERRPDIATRFAWKDVDEEEETEKPMLFWLKRLRP